MIANMAPIKIPTKFTFSMQLVRLGPGVIPQMIFCNPNTNNQAKEPMMIPIITGDIILPVCWFFVMIL